MTKTNSVNKDNDNWVLSKGRTIPIGVGLREGEIRYLDEIAEDNDVTRHAILHYAVRSFLIDYRAGKIDLSPMLEEPPVPKKKLKLPEL